jgi:hypothetical protein
MKAMSFAILLVALCLQFAGCSSVPQPAGLPATSREAYVDPAGESSLGKSAPLPARVVELRGDKGELAKVSLGQKQGAVAGLQLEFFVFADYSDLVPGAKREPSPIAYGLVAVVEENFAWVQVTDPEKAVVKRGHYARISAIQPQGLFAKIKGLFKGKKKESKEAPKTKAAAK